jgi:hypothetical protein
MSQKTPKGHKPSLVSRIATPGDDTIDQNGISNPKDSFAVQGYDSVSQVPLVFRKCLNR